MSAVFPVIFEVLSKKNRLAYVMASKSRLIGTAALFIISLFLVVSLTGWIAISVFSSSTEDLLKKVYQGQAQLEAEQISTQYFERYSDVKAVDRALRGLQIGDRRAAAKLLDSYASLYRLYDLILFVDQRGQIVVHNEFDVEENPLAQIQVTPEQVRSTQWHKKVLAGQFTEDQNRGLKGVFFDLLIEDPLLASLPDSSERRAVFATRAQLGTTEGVLVAYSRLNLIRNAVESQFGKFVEMGLGESSIRIFSENKGVIYSKGTADWPGDSKMSTKGVFVDSSLKGGRFPESLGWRVQIHTPKSEVTQLIRFWRQAWPMKSRIL